MEKKDSISEFDLDNEDIQIERSIEAFHATLAKKINNYLTEYNTS